VENCIALSTPAALSFQLLFARSVRLDLMAFAAIIVPVRMRQANEHHWLDNRWACGHQVPRHLSQFLGEWLHHPLER